MEIILSKPHSYITNIIKALSKQKEQTILNEIKNNLTPGMISVYADSNIIENNELINCYYIYANFENVNVYTTNEMDYTACVLRRINLAYDSGDDNIMFIPLMEEVKKCIHFEFLPSVADNYIFISNENVINVGIPYIGNVLSFHVNSKLKTDEDYKENILNKFTPTQLIKSFSKYSLLKMKAEECKFFSIYSDENGEYLYNKNNDWLTKERPELEPCQNSLLVDLQLFELRCKQEIEFNKKYTEILSRKRDIDFRKTFKCLSVSEDIFERVQMKTYILRDIIEPLPKKEKAKKTTYNILYPCISGTTVNNGVSEYVGYYMIDSETEILIVCMRKNAPGFTTVHKGKFAINSSVNAFRLKNGIKLNPYNVAFSITKTFSQRKLTNGITVDKLMKSKIKILL